MSNSQTKPIFTEIKLFEGDFCPRLSPDLLESWETQTQQTDDESSVSGIDSVDTLLESSDDTQKSSDEEDVFRCSDHDASPGSVVDNEDNVDQERPVLHKNSIALSKSDDRVQNKRKNHDKILSAHEDNPDEDDNPPKTSGNHQSNDNFWDKVAAIQRPKKSTAVRKQNTKGKQRIVMNRVVIEASLPALSDESLQESSVTENDEASNFSRNKESTETKKIGDDLDDVIAMSLSDSQDTDDEDYQPISKSQKKKTKGKKNTMKIRKKRNQNQKNTEIQNISGSDDEDEGIKKLGTKNKVAKKPRTRGKNV